MAKKNTTFVLQNPLPIPVPVDPKFMAGGAVALGGVAWFWWRSTERKKLVRAMENDPNIFAVRAFYATSESQPKPKDKWLVQSNGLQNKAAEVVTYTNATNAAQGLQEVLGTLPALPQGPGSAINQLLNKGFEEFETATGIKVPRSVKQETRGISQTEQGQAVDSIAAQGQSLWDAIMGDDAKENPDLSWGSYLGALALE